MHASATYALQRMLKAVYEEACLSLRQALPLLLQVPEAVEEAQQEGHSDGSNCNGQADQDTPALQTVLLR